MGTIEERAKQICVDTFCSMCPKRVYTTCIWRHNTERSQPKCGISEYRGLIKDAYHAAIVQLQEQHEELTCWHDPKDLPDRGKDVLLKMEFIESGELMYSVGYWYDSYFSNTLGLHGEVIGWREIHE